MYSSDDEPSVDEEHTNYNSIQDHDTIPDTAPFSNQNTDVEPDIIQVETVTNKNNNVEPRSDEVTIENKHPSSKKKRKA